MKCDASTPFQFVAGTKMFFHIYAIEKSLAWAVKNNQYFYPMLYTHKNFGLLDCLFINLAENQVSTYFYHT